MHHVHALCWWKPEEGIAAPEIVDADHVGAANLTWVPQKTSEWYKSPRYPCNSGKDLKFCLCVKSYDISRDANFPVLF